MLRVQYPGAIRETTMTLAWIAGRLHMGATGRVACLLYRNNLEAGRSDNRLIWPRYLVRALNTLRVITASCLIVPVLMLSVVNVCGETACGWGDKVEPALLTQAAAGEVEFLVMLSQQADLSGANSLPSKRQKGAYVFQRLTEVAGATQDSLVKQLESWGVEHRVFWIANMVWVRGNLAVVCSLAQREDVARLMLNGAMGVINPAAQTNLAPPPNDFSSNLEKVRAPEVWAMGYTGQGVVIGGQDTGYQWDHPALKRSYRGWDGTNVDHSYNWHDAIHSTVLTNPCGIDLMAPCDDYGHGTETMGVMVGDDGGAHRVGMAPGAKWIGARNMNYGRGSPATYADCCQWFLAPTDLQDEHPDPSKAPDVINNSWGCWKQEGCVDPQVLKLVVETVRAAGIVFVAGAGDGPSQCGSISSPPAIYAASLTVGGTSELDVILDDSSWGPVTVDGSNRMKPDVCAPGYSVPTCARSNSYGYITATSGAAPHVAGQVALLLSAHPELRGQVDAIERLIKYTAVPLTNFSYFCDPPGTNVPNNLYGWGRIDAFTSLALGDSDGDGIPDWWMIARFGHATGMAEDHSREGDDADGDGASNLDEYISGTDPLNAASCFRVAASLSASECLLSFQSSIGRAYTLLSRLSLEAPGWTPVPGQSGVPGTGETLELHAPFSLASGGFYRVEARVGP
jgi:serine protease AprX